MPQTLASRIFLTFAAILATAMMAFGVYVEGWVRDFHREQAEGRLSTASKLLHLGAEQVLLGNQTVADCESRLAKAIDSDNLRITIIDKEGVVLCDTVATLPIENHGTRPEVLASMDAANGVGVRERKSATTGIGTFYLAQRIDVGSDTIGVIRVATELDAMMRDLARVRRIVVLSGLLALLASLIGSAIVARVLTQPLVKIQQSAERAASGDLMVPIRVTGPVEVTKLADSINRLSEDLRSQLDTLRSQRSEIEAVLRSMAEGVVAVGYDEKLLMMNDAAAKLTGMTEPLEPGDELWKHCRFPELEQALRDALRGKVEWHGDASPPDGSGRILSISASTVQPLLGAVAIMSDVTSIRRLEQVRIDFVANVSHEMRTPLAAVLGAIETLDGASSDEDRARFYDIARRNAQRMQNIVADLLELSHIEAEADQIMLSPTSVELPVRTSASALAGEAEAKGVALQLERCADPNLRILGNDKRLEQIFTNLIANAIKYTPRGGRIDVRFSTTASHVTITVADTGIGIPRDALPRVFERFYRVDKSRSREMGGTGLGLAIVKHATRAHGGRVEVESIDGVGTTFRVILPRLKVTQPSTVHT